jgi:hypothetical protein
MTVDGIAVARRCLPRPTPVQTVFIPPPGDLLDCDAWRVERRSDGALLVRISSRLWRGNRLPDAVFSFRCGDPQYGYWEERFQQQQTLIT